MHRFQGIIARRARRRQSEMHDRSPAFQSVMAVVMEQIGHPDRSARSRRFNRRKLRVIVHDRIGQQDLLVAAPPHVQRRKIIKRPRRSHACEQPIILFIPKAVPLRALRRLILAGRWCSKRRRWRFARRRLGVNFRPARNRCKN